MLCDGLDRCAELDANRLSIAQIGALCEGACIDGPDISGPHPLYHEPTPNIMPAS